MAHKERKEMVNHPKHYMGNVTYEVWKCLNAWGLEQDALLWSTVKYIARCGKKEPDELLQDLEKAKWYLYRRIKLLKHPERAPK